MVSKPVVVDAHQHFWFDPTVEDYPWMTGETSSIRRTYGPDDLRPLLVASDIDCTVVVQTRSSLDETKSFLGLAAHTDFVAGVVGWVDLTASDVAAQLRDLLARPGGHYLAGIRHQVHDEPDGRWLLRENVLSGLSAVADLDLAFDLLVRSRELPAAVELARRFPRLRFVVDHIAKPSIAAGQIDEWAERMAPLADLPNVSCKLSGMVTEASWTSWSVEDLIPYVERVVGWFGPNRLMFGSDWPVCLLAASYADVVTAYRAAIASLPGDAQNAVFGGSAITFYRLSIQSPPL
jgi:L-fucono-1,5-lactonase